MSTKFLQDKLKKIGFLPEGMRQIVLGALLSKLFESERVKLTVVGGAAVQFYTQAEYVTKDLDAVLQGDTEEIIDRVMGGLGFSRTKTWRHFRHPDFNFTVEFPPSPIAVASRVIDQVSLIETNEGAVRVIRIEDIIMDRITAAVEWKQEPSLAQAKLLWMKNKRRIDKKYLVDFAKKEGYLKILKEVMNYQVK